MYIFEIFVFLYKTLRTVSRHNLTVFNNISYRSGKVCREKTFFSCGFFHTHQPTFLLKYKENIFMKWNIFTLFIEEKLITVKSFKNSF